MHVAQMPWDISLEPPKLSSTPTLPSNAGKTEMPPSSLQQNYQNGGNSRIKTEGGYDSVYNSQMPYASNTNMTAQERATSLLTSQYGSQANPSIQSTFPQQPGMGQRQPPPMNLQMPGQGQQRPTPAQQQQQQQQQQYQQYQQQQRSNLGAAQTDGGGDAEWDAMLAERRALRPEDIEQADESMRNRIAQMAYSQDSGLMVPLSEQSKPKGKGKVRATPASARPAGLDGVASDDDEDTKEGIKEDDEDAINSDLDDEDDTAEVENDDDDQGHVLEAVLCTYDKVQRVKNKWKCTLKDGVLHTGGKE